MDNHFDKLPGFYFSCTGNAILVAVNEPLCTALGYNKEELMQKKIDLIFTIATRIFYQTHFLPLLQMQGHAEEIYISLQTKNKEELPVLLNAETIVFNGETNFVHTGIAVRNRKKFEDELVAAKKTAENALQQNTALMQTKQELQKNMEQLDLQMHMVNKQNEELRQFNHVVTHDLQEPLRKLSVFINLFLDNPEKKDHKLIAEKIINASQKMNAVISGLQQYVWLTEFPVTIKEINLNALLLQVQQRLLTEFPEAQLLLKADDLPGIQADEEQIKMLFYHLLSNTVRYKKPGNKACVTIFADIVKRNKFRNVPGKYEYTDFLKLQVKDEGIGFNSKYIEQAFDLFRRLHTENGLGIGLSLCKKIAENHYGYITIDTVEGKGTTVTVWLPLQHA